MNYRQFDAAQFQVGKFKLPFGLEENVSATNLDFASRSLMSRALTPGRDIGWMVHGRFASRILRYELGIFEHDGSNAKVQSGARVSGGRTTAARVSAQPFRPLKGAAAEFTIGAAWATTDVPEGLSSIRGRTVLGEDFFESDYPVSGARRRVGFETRWRPGPASVQAGYVQLTENVSARAWKTPICPLSVAPDGTLAGPGP